MEPFAVVGASRDPSKYGHKVLMDLKNNGYRVYGINPKYADIEGIPCYPDIGSLPERPGLLILVVPPEVTVKAVKEAEKAGIRKIWMQPGSECAEALTFCEKNGIDVIHNACIMIYRKEGTLSPGETDGAT
jgi:hypothetical protein